MIGEGAVKNRIREEMADKFKELKNNRATEKDWIAVQNSGEPLTLKVFRLVDEACNVESMPKKCTVELISPIHTHNNYKTRYRKYRVLTLPNITQDGCK